MKRMVYGENFKREVVAASLCADETVVSVARRYGVATSAIYAWRKDETLFGDKIPVGGQEFIPVCVTSDVSLPEGKQEKPTLSHSCQITLSLNRQRRIAIDGTFAIADLVALVRGVST